MFDDLEGRFFFLRSPLSFCWYTRSKLLSVFWFVVAPTLAVAQFTYTTQNGAATITGYSGTNKDVVIPSMTNGFLVTQVGANAFSGNFQITNVVIPYGVTNVGDRAFRSCSVLRSVSLGPNLLRVGAEAFSFCGHMTRINIPDGIREIGAYAFENCSGLTSINLGAHITVLPERSLSGCSALQSLRIPDTVRSIGNYALSGCSALCTLIMGDAVEGIGVNVFFGCSALATITIPNTTTAIANGTFLGSGLTNITVDPSNSVYTSIGGVLFDKEESTLLFFPPRREGSYSVPGSVTNIVGYAFQGCGLTNVVIGSNVTVIEDAAFYASSLQSVLIPDSVRVIAARAFGQCGNLMSATLGSGVVSIGANAFQGCALSSVKMPDSLVGIGEAAFAACASLTNVICGAHLYHLESRVFSGCSGLRSIVIPASVADLGSRTFEDCTALESVYFCGDAPPYTGLYVFSGAANAIAYVLPGTVGWAEAIPDIPVILWNPEADIFGSRAGTNGFTFNVSGSTNIEFVVEACTNAMMADWIPLQQFKLTNGSVCFTDLQSTNYTSRFYRFRSP